MKKIMSFPCKIHEMIAYYNNSKYSYQVSSLVGYCDFKFVVWVTLDFNIIGPVAISMLLMFICGNKVPGQCVTGDGERHRIVHEAANQEAALDMDIWQLYSN